MRGADTFQEQLFTLKRLDDFVPADHPLREIRARINLALRKLDGLFSRMYASEQRGGRPSIAPEKLLRAMVVQRLYSVRSERQLMEQVQYNLLYRWFIGLTMEDEVWVPTVFSKNRERLIAHDAVVALFNEVLAQAEAEGLLSGEHFSVDGRCFRHGPVTRVLCARMAVMMGMDRISKAKRAAMRRTPRARMPMHGRIARADVQRIAPYGAYVERQPAWVDCQCAGDAGRWSCRAGSSQGDDR